MSPRGPRVGRIWFQADPDVFSVLGPQSAKSRREYLNDAARYFHAKPYRLAIPATADDPSVTRLLSQAKEIIAVGMRLRRMANEYRSLLFSKAEQNVRMTFVVIDPGLERTDPLYRILERTTGDAQFVDRLVDQVNQSVAVFRELREYALGHGTPVNIYGYSELPMCGLTIADPHTEQAKMIAAIFGDFYEGTLHPFLEIDPSSDEGRRAYSVYFDYYSALLSRLRSLNE